MEESEVPLEHLHEHVKESAEDTGAVWISWVALSTAVLAVLAALNIADEYHLLKRKYDAVASDFNARAHELSGKLDEALREARRAG